MTATTTTAADRFTLVRHDGGRSDAGYRGTARDCVPRAIAIATGKPYEAIYQDLADLMRHYAKRARDPRRRTRTSPRNGVPLLIMRGYLQSLGWVWTPTMGIGTGTTVHLRPDELPHDLGLLICSVSRHVVTVNPSLGYLFDTYLDDRDGTRAVYGYYHSPRLVALAKAMGCSYVREGVEICP